MYELKWADDPLSWNPRGKTKIDSSETYIETGILPCIQTKYGISGGNKLPLNTIETLRKIIGEPLNWKLLKGDHMVFIWVFHSVQ